MLYSPAQPRTAGTRRSLLGSRHFAGALAKLALDSQELLEHKLTSL